VRDRYVINNTYEVRSTQVSDTKQSTIDKIKPLVPTSDMQLITFDKVIIVGVTRAIHKQFAKCQTSKKQQFINP